MTYNVDTVAQLRAVIRALRKSRGLSQADLGRSLGVNQKRIAKIEADPGVTSWNQVVRLISALGGRVAVQDLAANVIQAKTAPTPSGASKATRNSKKQPSW
ncbi:transcriptional regulator [Opitutaceae bacterium EW11]|nr:transcriptional regulator [Opitutaceae bacterium EW11]